MTNDTKSLLSSKTVWGVVVAMLALVGQSFGFTLGEAVQAEVVDTGLKVVEVAGLVLATYGRVTATKKIG